MVNSTWAHDVWEEIGGKLYWKISPSWGIKVGREAGNIHKEGYREIRYAGKRYLRHRLIYFMHTGEWPELLDHIDQDRSNDRFENLRIATRSINGHNSKSVCGKVPYRGVSLTRYGDFITYLKVNRKRTYIGTFKTAEEASHAYEKYRKEVVQCPIHG